MQLMMMLAVGLLQVGGGGGGGAAGQALPMPGRRCYSRSSASWSVRGSRSPLVRRAHQGRPARLGGIHPIYREIVLCQMADKPVWWAIAMYFCPPVGLVLMILLYIELANRFGQGAGFAIGMLCCGIIFVRS